MYGLIHKRLCVQQPCITNYSLSESAERRCGSLVGGIFDLLIKTKREGKTVAKWEERTLVGCENSSTSGLVCIVCLTENKWWLTPLFISRATQPRAQHHQWGGFSFVKYVQVHSEPLTTTTRNTAEIYVKKTNSTTSDTKQTTLNHKVLGVESLSNNINGLVYVISQF